jgi:protein-tyrosine-phosphatase
LAEGILRQRLNGNNVKHIIVSSAGTFAVNGQSASAPIVEVAAEHGADISGHRARHITRQILADADIVLGMERDHLIEANVVLRDEAGKYRLLSEFGPPEMRGEEIEDPYGAPRDFILAVYEQIEECVQGLLDDLLRNQS